MIDNQILLSDGRTLAYAEYGDPKGKPIFYFHGWPSSRLEAQLIESAAKKLNVRIIAIDRPGMGGSDFKPDRQIGDWPNDIVELANALELDRFAILGMSGGGPYVSACALKIPQRLTSAAIVSGLGPFNVSGATRGMMMQSRLIFFLARRMPGLLKLLFGQVAKNMRQQPDKFVSQFIASMSKPDQVALSRSEIEKIIIDGNLEAFRNGPQGGVWEAQIYVQSWGFNLQEIPMEIDLWHGELDTNVPVSMGRYQADIIPKCRANFLPEEGHLSLLINQGQKILEGLIS